MTPTRRPLRAAIALWLCTAVAGVLVFLTGSPAAAHASLLSTSPDEGAVVQQVPAQIVLTFNEPIRLDSGAVSAFTATGEDWAVDAQAQDNRLVVTPAADPGQGTVVIAWKVISEDGHQVGGALTFSIGAPSSGSAAPGAEASPGTPTSVSAARWAATGLTVTALLGLLVMAGVVVLGVGLPKRWTHHGLVRTLELLWNVALVGAVLAVPLEKLAQEGRGLSGLLDWLTWINGLTIGRSLLLFGAVLVAAILVRIARSLARPMRRPRTAPIRVASLGLATVSIAAAATFLASWPNQSTVATTAAEDNRQASTTKQSADLGAEGTVVLTVRQSPGRAVRLNIQLTDIDGKPLEPYARPTLTVRSEDIDLGTTKLDHLGAGRYLATMTIPRDGQWEAQVSVRTREFDNPVAVLPFAIG